MCLSISDTNSNRSFIPLDFELLETHVAVYQSTLGDRLEYELTLNDYSRMIHATDDASYDIENIGLEYDMVTQPELAHMIHNENKGHIATLYDHVLCHRNTAKTRATPAA